jgi:hypothetical protein
VSLTPVSTTQAELVAKFSAGVINTGGNFATGVIDIDIGIDTGGKFARGFVDTGGAP